MAFVEGVHPCTLNFRSVLKYANSAFFADISVTSRSQSIKYLVQKCAIWNPPADCMSCTAGPYSYASPREETEPFFPAEVCSQQRHNTAVCLWTSEGSKQSGVFNLLGSRGQFA